jgi:thiaminase/transcriptional activator TenA
MTSGSRFTEQLRAGSEPHWTKACGHRFTTTLADDTLDDDVFRRYLVQDYAFIETLVTVLGYAVAYAPDIGRQDPFRGLSSGIDERRERFLSARSTRWECRQRSEPHQRCRRPRKPSRL